MTPAVWARVAPIWLVTAVLAIGLSHAQVAHVAVVAGVALGPALVSLRWEAALRLAGVAALLGACVEPATLLGWTAAAVALSFAAVQHAGTVREPSIGELERYLERCRRRGEEATVMYLGMAASAAAVRRLLALARVTDSLVVRQARSRWEVYGLLEGVDVTRAAVEARFENALDGIVPVFGWASYPADGLTLDVLLDHARSSVAAEAASLVRGPAAASGQTTPEPTMALGFDGSMEATS